MSFSQSGEVHACHVDKWDHLLKKLPSHAKVEKHYDVEYDDWWDGLCVCQVGK
jgi:hypothetical protein